MNSLVYIIIINWNNAKDTIECLESLQKMNYENYRVVLVDNASTDDSMQKITAWLKISNFEGKTNCIPLRENLGFTGGNNVGIDHAIKQNTDYVLLLNNDTLVTENFLSLMI